MKPSRRRPLLLLTLDLVSGVFAWGCALLIVMAAGLLMYSTLSAGIGQFDWRSPIEWLNNAKEIVAFICQEPADSGRTGGIAPIILSTSLIVGVCLMATIPLGLGTAIYLSEFSSDSSWIGRWIRFSLDVLGGVPSIVFGLFGSAFFCVTLGLGLSILSGGLTLACMVLPICIRIAEASLRQVTDDYRQASASLGLSKWTGITKIILPAALPGLLAAFTLGLARALAETAALIFTSGYVVRYPESVFDSGRSLSVHIYDLAMNVTGGNERAFKTAAVLVVTLLVINAATHFLVKLINK